MCVGRFVCPSVRGAVSSDLGHNRCLAEILSSAGYILYCLKLVGRHLIFAAFVVCFILSLEAGSGNEAKADLSLTILLPESPEH